MRSSASWRSRRRASASFSSTAAIPGRSPSAPARLEQLALQRGRGDAVLRIGSDELSGEPGRVADEANSASLFGGEPVISLRVLDGRHNVIGALQPLFERPPEAAWVIVEAGELTPTNPLRKAFEASKRAVGAADLSRSRRKDLDRAHPRRRRGARRDGSSPPRSSCWPKISAATASRSAASSKSSSSMSANQKSVTLADVAAIVGDTTDVADRPTIDAALLGDSEALETGLGRMRAEASSFASLGAAALRHLLSLQTLRAAIDAGQGASEVINYARPPIFSRRRSTIEAELSRWPSAEHRRGAAQDRPGRSTWPACSRRSKTRRSRKPSTPSHSPRGD